MDPADPERPPTAEGGASGAEKGKKRDEIASISSNEPSGGTRVETDGLKGGGVEHDDGDGGDASPESASPSSRPSTGGSSRNGRSAVSAAALVGGSASGSETLTEPAGGPHAGPSGTPAPPQASGSADAGLQLQLQPAAQQHAPSARNLAGQEQQHAAQPPAANVGAPDAAAEPSTPSLALQSGSQASTGDSTESAPPQQLLALTRYWCSTTCSTGVWGATGFGTCTCEW